jgi:hypothetical protein
MKEILIEAAEIGPGHQPAMGTAKLTSQNYQAISLHVMNYCFGISK